MEYLKLMSMRTKQTNIKNANAIQERNIDEKISCQSNIFHLAIHHLPHDSVLQI